jgi:uncharacterized membrane protein
MDESLEGRTLRRSSRPEWVRLFIVVAKLLTATVELVSGVVLLTLSSGDVRHLVDRLLAHEAVEDPHDLLVRLAHKDLGHVLADKTFVGAALLTLAAVKIVGAIGLLRHRPWAFYLLVLLVALLLPIDVYRTVIHPTPVEAVLLALNVVILGLLIGFRASLVAREEAHAARES